MNTLFLVLFTLVAHRGGALLENENTIPAFTNAIEMGVDMIEIDVHQTSDGALVVCHDPTLDRTTDTCGKIEEMTLEQVLAARVKDFRTGEVLDYGIPTLQEVLDLAKGRCGVLLEIKRNRKGQYPGIEEKVLGEVNAAGMHDDVIIQSFDDMVVFTTNSLDPTARVEKLIFCRLPFGLCFDGGIRGFSFQKYDCCASINPMGSLIGKGFVKAAHKAGKEVKIWTINDPSKVIEGVDGVITNRPDLFL